MPAGIKVVNELLRLIELPQRLIRAAALQQGTHELLAQIRRGRVAHTALIQVHRPINDISGVVKHADAKQEGAHSVETVPWV